MWISFDLKVITISMVVLTCLDNFAVLGVPACKTVQNENCIFPFKYNDKMYVECTTDDSDNGRAWCATKVNSDGNVLRGKWGDCGNSCGVRSSITINRGIIMKKAERAIPILDDVILWKKSSCSNRLWYQI